LANEWKDLIGDDVHGVVSAPCPPVCFFVLGMSVFHETLLRFGSGTQFPPMLIPVLLRIARCSKCRPAECLNRRLAQKVGSGGGVRLTAVLALLLMTGNFVGIRLLSAGHSEGINHFHT
jgi:hypothetical protein